MIKNTDLSLDTSEVLRYMGIKSSQADEITLNLVEECKKEVIPYLELRSSVFEYDLTIQDDLVQIENLSFHSKDVCKNLSGCKRVVLFAATVGPKVDVLIKRYQKINMGKAVVLNAVAITAIESYCDYINETLRQEVQAKGHSLRPRYSPGYGDCSIEIQNVFLKMINAEKLAGIRLSDGNLMVPEKSVSAFIGIE